MKARLPSLPHYWKGALGGVAAAAAGYALFPLLGSPDPRLTLVAGLFAGALLGAFFAGLRVEVEKDSRSQTLFVGNLAFKATPEEVRSLFSQYGSVRSVRLMTHRNTRRSRGFGFVEMDRQGAKMAIRALDGNPFHGRTLRVNEGSRRREVEERAGN